MCILGVQRSYSFNAGSLDARLPVVVGRLFIEQRRDEVRGSQLVNKLRSDLGFCPKMLTSATAYPSHFESLEVHAQAGTSFQWPCVVMRSKTATQRSQNLGKGNPTGIVRVDRNG